MALTITQNGLGCVGGSGSSNVVLDIGTDTTEADNAISASAEVIEVHMHGYDPSAAATDFSCSVTDDSSNSDAMTQGAQISSGGQTSGVFYFLKASLSNISAMSDITKFTCNTTNDYNEGVDFSFVAWTSDGTPTLIDADADVDVSNNVPSVTLTGSPTDGHIGVGGADFDSGGQAFDITVQSQTQLETEESTSCNRNHYGNAHKDWDTGQTCQMQGYYAFVSAIAFDDPGAAGGFVPYPNPRYALSGGHQPMGGGVS